MGAIAHSVGQMAVAVLITGTPSIAVYLPVMVAISILTGSFTGFCAQFLVNRGKLWKIIFR
jgi:heptaprenyl diphosphate synthase